jgi:hypothetical protein
VPAQPSKILLGKTIQMEALCIIEAGSVVFTWSQQRAFSLFLFILQKQSSKFMPGKATKEDKTCFGSKNLRTEPDKSSR